MFDFSSSIGKLEDKSRIEVELKWALFDSNITTAMKARVKQLRQGKIAADRFSVKRKLDVDVKELNDLLATCKPREMEVPGQMICTPPVPTSKPPTLKVKDDGKDALPSAETLPLPDDSHQESKTEKVEGDILSQPIKGENEELIWPPDAKHPPVLQDLFTQVKAIYNLKDEIESFSCMIWPPREPAKGKKKFYTIPKAPMGVASRVILAVGGRENFRMSASAGGHGGKGSIMCLSGESFMVPIGVAAAIDYTFDNGTSFQVEAKDGWRARSLSKDPTKTYICVIDGLVNAAMLVRQIKAEADRLSNGNADISKQLQDKMGEALSLKPEDQVALEASKAPRRDAPEESIPDLIPSDIDQVIATVSNQTVQDVDRLLAGEKVIVPEPELPLPTDPAIQRMLDKVAPPSGSRSLMGELVAPAVVPEETKDEPNGATKRRLKVIPFTSEFKEEPKKELTVGEPKKEVTAGEPKKEVTARQRALKDKKNKRKKEKRRQANAETQSKVLDLNTPLIALTADKSGQVVPNSE